MNINKILIEIIKPKPMPFELISIGNGFDGTYLVPNDLMGIQACFSPGVNNYKYFEDFLTATYKIKSHMCDFSSDIENFSTPLIEGYQTFQKKWLDISGTPDSISLTEWVSKYSPNSFDDLILQMDIEGAEYRNILNTEINILSRFRIMVIEIHGFARILSNESNEVKDLFLKLDSAFDVVHATANNCCGEVFNNEFGINLPNVMEFTFLRKDRISHNDKFFTYPSLPHALDIINTRERPIFLNSKWLHSDMCTINETIIKNKLNEYDSIFFKNKYEALSSVIFKNLRHIPVRNLSLSIHSNEIANGKKYFIDSQLHSYDVVSEKTPFFFHTNSTIYPSITIDLEFSSEIHKMELFNRTDACFERAGSLVYIVHNDRSYDINDAMPIISIDDFIKCIKPAIVNIPLLKGRFITIVSFGSEPLHLSSIKIFGNQLR